MSTKVIMGRESSTKQAQTSTFTKPGKNFQIQLKMGGATKANIPEGTRMNTTPALAQVAQGCNQTKPNQM